MKTSDRILLLVKTVDSVPSVERTALMKLVYLLQTLEGVPFDYRFDITAQGIWSSELAAEIDFARQCGYICSECSTSPAGKFIEHITCTEEGKRLISGSPFVSAYARQIGEIAAEFGSRDVSDLDLLSATAYVATICKERSREDVAGLVGQLKPQYGIDYITARFDELLLSGAHLCRSPAPCVS